MLHDRVVGFIGLGNLGQAMALRLIERGRLLRVLDPKPERVEPLVAGGAVECDPAGIADADVICFAVPDDRAVLAVLDTGLGERLTAAHTVVVHSTILPERARALAAIVTATGARFVEAPVSGGAERARQGDLAVLVGADADALAAARPVIDDLAREVFVLGAVGAASAAKLANQLVMFSALAGLHEALALTSENGVADAAALAAFAAGTADTWVGRNWGFFDGIAADYDSAGVPLADRPWSKDLGEVLDAARASGLDLPFASLLAQTIASTIETHAAAARIQKGHDA